VAFLAALPFVLRDAPQSAKTLPAPQVAPAQVYQDPLIDAVASGDISKVKALIADGCDAREAADERGTVLIVAAAHGYRDIAALLIDAGCDVNETTFVAYEVNGQSLGDLPAMEMALTYSDMLSGTVEMTPLEMAARCGYIEVAQLLIDRGADVTAKTFCGMTALHYAAWNAHKAVAKLLIEKGANVRAIANDQEDDATQGFEPIHCAVNSADVTALLLDNGAAVDAKDTFDSTPLMLAVERGNAGVASLLVARGANTQALDGRRRSALHILLDKAIDAAAETGDDIAASVRGSGGPAAPDRTQGELDSTGR